MLRHRSITDHAGKVKFIKGIMVGRIAFCGYASREKRSRRRQKMSRRDDKNGHQKAMKTISKKAKILLTKMTSEIAPKSTPKIRANP
jgi:hypothetical protein